MHPAAAPTSFRRVGSRLLVGGDLDRSARHGFWSALAELLAEQPREVQVELDAVTFMDATGLTVLLRAQRDALERGTRLVLIAPSVPVLRILERTQATPLFEIRV